MNVYVFPAIKGFQANKEYYTAMIPLKLLQELFQVNEGASKPEHRAQRKLNIKRIPIIKKYILENRDSYVFSALAASIDGNFRFEPTNEKLTNIGTLIIEKNTRFLINDGQHRTTAIIEALTEDFSLGDETIAVVLYKDEGLKRSQQMFSDLNRHAVKTSNSIAELYDSTDPISECTRYMMNAIPFIDKYTDKEKDNLSKFSAALFVFNTFYKSNQRIIGKDVFEQNVDKDFIVNFWKSIVEGIELWKKLDEGTLSKVKLRSEYLVCQSVVVEAFGVVGHYFYHNRDNWETKVKGIREIDWQRKSPVWKNRCIKDNMKMTKNEQAILLTANAIKEACGIPLNEEETLREELLRGCK